MSFLFRPAFTQLWRTSWSCQGQTLFQNRNKRTFSVQEVQDLKKIIFNKVDSYGGLHFDTSTDQSLLSTLSTDQFERLVEQQIVNSSRRTSEEEKEVRALWFRISKAHVHLIAPLVKLGFEFHHTKSDAVVLVKPLSPSSNIPKYAYTNIGVGALVVDESLQRVLVVKEKRFIFKQVWKFPGGYVEQGEELHEAILREVLEETGVRANFRTLLAFRHAHRFAFDCSDMYFVALLRPTTTAISFCDQEIEECQWASLSTVVEQMSPFNRFVIEQYQRWKGSSSEKHQNPLLIRPQTFEPYFAKMSPYTLYSVKYDEKIS